MINLGIILMDLALCTQEWRLTLKKFWTLHINKYFSSLVNTKTSFNGINRFMTFFSGQSYDFQAPCERMDISWLWKILKDVSQSHIWWQMNAPDLHKAEIVVESGSLWIMETVVISFSWYQGHYLRTVKPSLLTNYSIYRNYFNVILMT